MGALSLSQAFILLKWLASAFFWALLTTVLDYLPVSWLRPKRWCAWKVQDISPPWLTTQLRKNNHIGPSDVVQRVEVQVGVNLTSFNLVGVGDGRLYGSC
jgi:hypothetical protein